MTLSTSWNPAKVWVGPADDHHRKGRFLVVAGPFDAAQEIERVFVRVLEELPASIEPADRRPIVVELILRLKAGHQQRIVVAAHQVGVRIEEVQRRRHYFQAGQGGEMAHLHGQVVVRDLHVELRQDQPVEAVRVVEAGLQAVALSETPILAVDDVDTAADVKSATIGLRGADEIQPGLIQLVLATAIVREDGPVETIRPGSTRCT